MVDDQHFQPGFSVLDLESELMAGSKTPARGSPLGLMDTNSNRLDEGGICARKVPASIAMTTTAMVRYRIGSLARRLSMPQMR
jgi:hypothetical protein